MALPVTIYKAGIQLADLDRSIYETLQTTVARHPSETEERLVGRLLAFALTYEDGLCFTKGICEGDVPDLWLKGPDGRIKAWVEVGLPDPDRLLKARRHADQVTLVAFGAKLPSWERQHLDKLIHSSNITVIIIEQEFISQLVARLKRSIDWSITITEGNIYLQDGGETLETSPRRHGQG